MSSEEPIILPLGTEVSAKYRGAFCEAKIKKIIKCVKCRVTVKDTNQHLNILDDDIKGPVKVGGRVEIKHPDSGQYVEASINKVTDSSTYTVVFDDGDENTLRRTQLCLKGEKHFVKSETLDQLPLTHPEHFGTPVMKSGKGFKRRRGDKDGSDSESDDDSDSDSPPKKRTYKGRLQEMVGKVMLMETEDRKRTYWVPALVVSPNANDLELKHNDHLLVKSFKDSKFYAVTKRELKEFTRDHALKNDDKTIKAAMDKALSFFEHKDLPTNWDKEELLGTDSESSESESESSDDEPSEEKDRFVAQLYKFMDDRGTPINKGPTVGNRDLNLYRLFRVVQNVGGYNKVTNQMKWRAVYTKMNLPSSSTGSNQIKAAYKKYLHAFEDFYRKLGSTMGTISRPGRSRHNSGRSLLSFRERESPRSPRSERKIKEEKETDTIKDESDTESETPRKSRSSTRQQQEEKRMREEASTPTTRMTTREDVSKLAAVQKEDKSPSKADKNKQDDKRKNEKVKEIKKDKEEEKHKGTKEDDAKKKKVPTATLR